jgi:membrane protease YdiL (CAAX protease family)
MQNYNQGNRIQYFADILILIVSAVVFSLLGVVVAAGITHQTIADVLQTIQNQNSLENAIGMLKFYNVFATFGAWVVSAFLFCKIRSYPINLFWQFQKGESRVWLYIPLIFIAAQIISVQLIQVNHSIQLPKSIQDAFNSFQTKAILERMLAMHSESDLFLNLFVIALLPALFEEIFFRGTLQTLLINWVKNHHVGIWLSSLVFTLIHFNLEQIIPMFFLALLLGYAFYFSKSIWVSIAIHFCNNALAVLMYYYQNQSDFIQQISKDEFQPHWVLVIISVLMLIATYLRLNQLSKTTATHE